jgi:LysM repeat protein
MIRTSAGTNSVSGEKRRPLLCSLFRQAVLPGLACVLILPMVGCAELEPMVEPEVADLQLTVETLKTQVREAQRTAAELRTELEARRQELAEAQVARAQLEGKLREAERRVAEARQIISLQREELAAARSERERITRSSAQLQNRMKRLQKSLHRVGDLPEAFPEDPLLEGQPVASQGPAGRTVIVKAGDTLWRIAGRYRVDLEQLRSLNRLPDNRIMVGQVLRVPGGRTVGNYGAEDSQGGR